MAGKVILSKMTGKTFQGAGLKEKKTNDANECQKGGVIRGSTHRFGAPFPVIHNSGPANWPLRRKLQVRT